ncbi:MAG TPA: hypothetical protein VGG28_02895 [Kofleriaceae bacterium]|jgi:hypothetical protein
MNRFAIAVMVLAACSKSDSKKAAAPVVTAIDAAAVNALVPAELKAKLVFDKTDVIEDHGKDKVTFTVAAPKGWKQDGTMFATLKGGDDVGFMTQMHLASDCDGSCEPKDWAKSADKVVFDQFKDAGVVKNDTTPTSRLLIATRDKTTFVAYAWWNNAERHYHFCSVTLEEPVAAAAPAFAKACQAVNVAGEH